MEDSNKPDGIIFDLEDSVHPDFKEEARENLRDFFGKEENRKAVFDNYIVFIRANPYKTKHFKEDVRLVNEIRPHFLMLSKVESQKELKAIRKMSKAPQLFVVVESLKGIHNINSILRTMDCYDLFLIGYEDLSAEIGIERPENLNSINLITNLLLNSFAHARRHGIVMMDAVSRKFSEKGLDSFREECLFTSQLGLTGKVCIHPNQVPIANGVWEAKNRLMLKRGEKVLEGFKSLKDGSFVIVNERKEMMDTPSYKMYGKLLKKLGDK